MAHDHDRRTTNAPRHEPGSVNRGDLGNRSAVQARSGKRWQVINDDGMAEKGGRENEAGKDRQKKNDAV